LLVGRYLFADYSSQRIWTIGVNQAPTLFVALEDGWDSGVNIASFAQDIDGELFVIDVRTSGIWKLVPQ